MHSKPSRLLSRSVHNYRNKWVVEWFTSLSVQLWQCSDRRKHEVGTMPYSYRMTSMVLYSTQYHRQHCTLQDFEQFGALYMHNADNAIRPGRDSNPVGVAPNFEPQSDWMSHRGPAIHTQYSYSSDLESQKTVTAHSKRKQLLHFGFARQCCVKPKGSS